MAAVTLTIVVVVAGVFLWNKGRPAVPLPAVAPAAADNATNPPGAVATRNPKFEKLKGKWLRPDGGYIVEIQSVEAGGKLDAAYLNPRPIHVARAEASEVGGIVKVFIELRDVNYPGSTYNLIFDPQSNSLKGIYYQAVQQQQFEVVFEKME